MTKVPIRKDGMPDLNNWKEFVKNNSLKTLGQIIEAIHGDVSPENILLQKAVSEKRNEIAEMFIDTLCAEELSTKEAISVLSLTQKKITELKFIP